MSKQWWLTRISSPTHIFCTISNWWVICLFTLRLFIWVTAGCSCLNLAWFSNHSQFSWAHCCCCCQYLQINWGRGDTGSDKQLMERIWTRRDITFFHLSVKRLRFGTSRQCTKRQRVIKREFLFFWSFISFILWIVSGPKCQVIPQQLKKK